jgi:hypothetical protein
MADLTGGYDSLGKDINKVHTDQQDTDEGVISELLPELELSMSDDELIDLKHQWQKNWEQYELTIRRKQDDNERYWLGKQFSENDTDSHPLVDNLIFEGLETFLPIATRPKADPLVESDNSEKGNELADTVRKMLAFNADRLSFNLELKMIARYWALYMLGALKVGWSLKENDITCQSIRPQKLILDRDATIVKGEYTGEYIGEYRKDTARNLIKRFPKKKEYIKEKCQEKLGTTMQYIEWWTDEYVFWTLEDEVLSKSKNPHWNYEQQQPTPMNEMGQQPIDPQTGQPQTQTIPGSNHFKVPKKPYIFLSVFNIGLHPVDDTNLIQQNLPLQDLINKRLRQIDKNADNTNGGLIISGDHFTKEQSGQATEALRRGGSIWVPTGNVNDAVRRDTGTPLPEFVYESLIDYRNELRNIFGTRGSTPQGTISEDTVRGKLLTKSQDSDRIGGGISTYLEQFSDKTFNWFTQLFYVYYDEPHSASVLGSERSKEWITLRNTDFNGIGRLTVGVKEGSMIPKDPLTQRNEAMDLWSSGGLDPITFFDRLEFPNPRETAKQLYLWKSDPVQLFPDLAQAAAQQQKAPPEKPPSMSIPFADLPPEGQVQVAAKAGIQLTPQGIEQHKANVINQGLHQESIQAQQAPLNQVPLQ